MLNDTNTKGVMDACYVECDLANNLGRDLACSGILLDRKKGLILTHGTLLADFLIREKCDIKDIKIDRFNSFPLTCVFQNVIYGAGVNTRALNTMPSSLSQNNEIPFRQKGTITLTGNIIKFWECEKLRNALNQLMPSSRGWTLNPESQSKQDSDLSDLNINRSLLSYFILIHVEIDPIHEFQTVSVLNSNDIKKGEPVVICGTPFGSVCPDVLFNSVTKGIVCNTFGEDNILIINDARCFNGQEGAPVYLSRNQSRILGGIVISPLLWKNGEWLGLSLAASLSPVLESLSMELKILSKLSVQENSEGICCDNLGDFEEHLALLKAGSQWGTGLFISNDILLTCGHVVRETEYVQVKVNGGNNFEEGERIWIGEKDAPFDLAVVRLKSSFSKRSEFSVCFNPLQGSHVFAIGFPLFGSWQTIGATYSAGIISKINEFNSIPIIIQTDCVVNPGASGGEVVSKDGSIVGLICCNASGGEDGKACHPTVNLSIPLVTIWPVIQEFLEYNDSSVLNKLTIRNSTVRSFWRLNSIESKISSKL